MGRSTEEVRRAIERVRDELASSVEALREGIATATDVGAKLRTKLPAAAAGALGVGFVLAGGIGAVMRLLARRSREGDERARVGRFSIVDRG